jgi:ribosome biogenesis protein BRX1
MGKKRKHSETQVIEPAKKDESETERPKRTLLGWKDKPEEKETESLPPHQGGFRNKEKVLVTCSRRINYRFRKDLIFFFEYLISGFCWGFWGLLDLVCA